MTLDNLHKLDQAAAVRLHCVEMLLQSRGDPVPNIVANARELADFILGTNDAEVLGAARDLAEKVKEKEKDVGRPAP